MGNYIDLVLCEQNGRQYLFQAPAWSGLKKGDAVRVDTKHGEQPADVVAAMTVNENDSEKIEFARAATGAHLPLRKVTSLLVYANLVYPVKEAEQAD